MYDKITGWGGGGGRHFSLHTVTMPAATHPPPQWVPAPGGVNPTTHLLLGHKIRINGAVPPFPHT
jgi:hypothetical protein